MKTVFHLLLRITYLCTSLKSLQQVYSFKPLHFLIGNNLLNVCFSAKTYFTVQQNDSIARLCGHVEYKEAVESLKLNHRHKDKDHDFEPCKKLPPASRHNFSESTSGCYEDKDRKVAKICVDTTVDKVIGCWTLQGYLDNGHGFNKTESVQLGKRFYHYAYGKIINVPLSSWCLDLVTIYSFCTCTGTCHVNFFLIYNENHYSL